MVIESKESGQERVGGKSGMDEAGIKLVSQVVVGLSGMVMDIKPIQEAIKHLSPAMRKMSVGLPVVAAYGFAKLPAKLFRSSAMEQLFRTVIDDVADLLDRKIRESGGIEKMSESDYADALDEGMKAAFAKKYVVDPMGNLHRANCVRLSVFRRPHTPRKDRNGNDIPPPPSQLQEVGIEEAITQKLLTSPCCFDGTAVDAATKTDASKAAKAEQYKSFADLLGRQSPEDQQKFWTFFSSKNDATKDRIITLAKHVDSMNEFKTLMGTPEDQVEDTLAFYENTNAGLQLGNTLGSITTFLKESAASVSKAATQFDESLAPVVRRLEANRKSDDRKLTLAVLSDGEKPRERAPWYKAVLRVF